MNKAGAQALGCQRGANEMGLDNLGNVVAVSENLGKHFGPRLDNPFNWVIQSVSFATWLPIIV